MGKRESDVEGRIIDGWWKIKSIYQVMRGERERGPSYQLGPKTFFFFF